jgi:hypothetical protein
VLQAPKKAICVPGAYFEAHMRHFSDGLAKPYIDHPEWVSA